VCRCAFAPSPPSRIDHVQLLELRSPFCGLGQGDMIVILEGAAAGFRFRDLEDQERDPSALMCMIRDPLTATADMAVLLYMLEAVHPRACLGLALRATSSPRQPRDKRDKRDRQASSCCNVAFKCGLAAVFCDDPVAPLSSWFGATVS
jgi:hypothetical protein